MSVQCEYIYRIGHRKGERCPNPTVNGIYYCLVCANKKVNHPLRLIGSVISEALYDLFPEAEKLKVTSEGYLKIKYPHPFKPFSLIRQPDRALVHFVKKAEDIGNCEDLRDGDIVVIKPETIKIATADQDSFVLLNFRDLKVERSKFPLLYWKILMDVQDPISFNERIRSHISELKKEDDRDYVTFLYAGVWFKIINDGFSTEGFTEALKHDGNLWLTPDDGDLEKVSGENNLYLSHI